jgi:protein-L-isoaspartate(D-aspartate) O-methyltransferase
MSWLTGSVNTKIQEMLDTIRMEAELCAGYTGRKSIDERVLQAMQEVDRKLFVPEHCQSCAYDNAPLPIGHGQTISQPFIVALMTDLLDCSPGSTILEIGTGSGYQAAILSRLVKQVYTIEQIPELVESSSQKFKKVGYKNIETRCSNGYYGWAEKAPFDAIIVTAAAPHIPQSLIEQLKPGGRMIIPVGRSHMSQELMLVTKDKNGATNTQPVLAVAFVPLVMEDDENSR